MKRYNVHLSEQQINKLRELAKKTGSMISELIRRAIDGFLEKNSGKMAR